MPTQQLSAIITVWAIETQCNEAHANFVLDVHCFLMNQHLTWLYWPFYLWVMHLNKIKSIELPEIIPLTVMVKVMVRAYILKMIKLLVWSQQSTDPEFGTWQ